MSPIAGVAAIGSVMLFFYKKKRGCFRSRKTRRNSLLDDFETEGWKNTTYTSYEDKFDPAKNY